MFCWVLNITTIRPNIFVKRKGQIRGGNTQFTIGITIAKLLFSSNVFFVRFSLIIH